MSVEEEQAKLTELIEPLLDDLGANAQFYREAASNLRSADLADLFRQRAAERETFAAELADETAVDLHETDDSGLLATLERGLMTMRAALTIERDLTDRVVLAEAQEVEQRLLEAYLAVLDEDDMLTPALRAAMQRQYAQVRSAATYVAAATAETADTVVLALFNSSLMAQDAVRALLAEGLSRDQIAVLAEEKAVRDALEDERGAMTQATAGVGALGGGVFGGIVGLFSGVGMALGLGPVLLVGLPLAAGATAVGSAIGAAYGGLFGALIGYGIGAEDVEAYINGLRRGQILVAASVAPDAVEPTRQTLAALHGQQIATRYGGLPAA